ncbi:UNVERIFIED_CONTAM: hypothetical protein RMT77_005165 [Armadillidium vulgare]
MPQVSFQHVVSFTSEDKKCKVENLLSGNGMWLSSLQNQSSSITADLQLEKAISINFIDIGNYNCAMIRVDVGMSTWPSTQDFVSLLPTVVLMTPTDCRTERNSKAVRMFKKEDLDKENVEKKWDRVRIVCSQPFRKNVQFGLTFFKVHSQDVSSELNNSLKSPTIKITEDIKDEMKSVLYTDKSPQTIPNSLQSLEQSRLNAKGIDCCVDSCDARKLSSPLSRGAQLVMARKQMLGESKVKVDKKALELEALEFLLSLSLTRSDIHSLRVSHIRTEFESRRKRPLDTREKLIFKGIALDFSAERLKKLDLESNSDAENNKRTLSSTNHSSPTAVDKTKRNLQSLNRNSLALSDSVVTNVSNKRKRYETTDVDELEHSTSSLNKFTSSSAKNRINSKIVTIDLDDEDYEKSIPNDIGNDFPVTDTNSYKIKEKQFDKYGTVRRRQNGDSSSCSTFIECPICSDLFSQNEIENHASICEGNNRSESPSLERMEECPVCGSMFDINQIQTHAEECAERNFF